MQVKSQALSKSAETKSKSPNQAKPGVQIRPLNADDPDELELIAVRMRDTLVEVLGRTNGTNLYSMDWLRNRVRWHLDPEKCDGRIFVATDDGRVVGHSIVRVDADDNGEPIGLFSTTYVEPKSRGRKIATAHPTRRSVFDHRGLRPTGHRYGRNERRGAARPFPQTGLHGLPRPRRHAADGQKHLQLPA